MCFYFGLPSTPAKISKRYKIPFELPEQFIASEKYNGFAHPTTPIITNDKPDVIGLASWGLLPHWTKDKAFRKNTLNARIETVESLPSFRDVLSNRCLIPATCFYDWRHEGKTKIPYTVYNQESEIFSFAGIYSDWVDATTDEVLRTYSILTTEANDTMKYIHNVKQRMPIILKVDDEEKWLGGDVVQKYAFPYSVQLVGFPVI